MPGPGCGCADSPDERHGYAVAEALWVEHVVFWREQVVSQHLPGFSFLDGEVGGFDDFFHEGPVEEFAGAAPLGPVVH